MAPVDTDRLNVVLQTYFGWMFKEKRAEDSNCHGRNTGLFYYPAHRVQRAGAVISMLGRRAPELRHIRRWLQAVFAEPAGEDASTQMLAGWFATSGTGVLFLPRQPDQPYTYCEIGVDI